MRGATYSQRGDYENDCTLILAKAYAAGGAINLQGRAIAARASLIRAGLLEAVPRCRVAVRLTKAGQRRAADIWAALHSRPSTARHHRRDRNRVIHCNHTEGKTGPWSPQLAAWVTRQLR
jgi:hypothetical protein